MGYILPISNYQMQHYHERVTQPEHDPIPIERLYPKKVESSYEFIINHDRLEQQSEGSDQNQTPLVKKYPRNISQDEIEQYAHLTGIGGQINFYA